MTATQKRDLSKSVYTSVQNRKRKIPVSSPKYARSCSTCRYNSVLHTALFYAAPHVIIFYPKKIFGKAKILKTGMIVL